MDSGSCAGENDFTALLPTSVLNVFNANENRPWRNFHCFHHRRFFQQSFLSSIVLHTDVVSRRDVEMCARLTGSIDEVRRLLCIPHNKIAERRLRCSAPLCQQQSHGRSKRTTQQHSTVFQTDDSCEIAKPDILGSPSTGCPHSAPITLQLPNHQF